MVLVRGKTTAELGAHEWFMSAANGETQTPIGESEGVASVNEFVVNCVFVFGERSGRVVDMIARRGRGRGSTDL